ncbi:CRISPR-associated protein Cas4 [Azotosporobacter soli]|uniref:CRISPR-associated protein Cas4 n=1 Tax=Azotosporobacter soli TaxID=3055040 RepID=UPI0031FED985
MTLEGVTLLILLGFAAWLRRSLLRRRLRPWQIERTICIETPVELIGRPDVVWLDGTGRLVVGDYKNRSGPQVFESERIQLSAYRFLLRHSQGRSVAKHGYIHFADGQRVRVALLTDRQVLRLYRRYQKIISGRSEAQRRERDGYCTYCDYQNDCR